MYVRTDVGRQAGRHAFIHTLIYNKERNHASHTCTHTQSGANAGQQPSAVPLAGESWTASFCKVTLSWGAKNFRHALPCSASLPPWCKTLTGIEPPLACWQDAITVEILAHYVLLISTFLLFAITYRTCTGSLGFVIFSGCFLFSLRLQGTLVQWQMSCGGAKAPDSEWSPSSGEILRDFPSMAYYRLKH